MRNSNKTIIRTGSSPRTIFYSQSKDGHEYDYGKPLIQITGNASKHIKPFSSTERKLLDNITIFPQPDTYRTINPKPYNNNTTLKYKKTQESLDNNLLVIKETKQKSIIKTNPNKNARSKEIKNKNKIKANSIMKTKYDYKSEILNLPGNCKRNELEIKDDLNKDKNINKKIQTNSTAACLKNQNLYNSKISCLDNANNFHKNYSTGVINNKRRKIFNNFSNIMYSSNNIFYSKNEDKKVILPYQIEQGNENKNNKNNDIYLSNYMKDYKFKTIDNSNDLITNYNNNSNNYNSKGNKTPFPNDSNFFNAYNEKNSCDLKNMEYINNSHRKKNYEIHKRLFNEVHYQEKPVSLKTSYSRYYNKKNQSQIILG